MGTLNPAAVSPFDALAWAIRRRDRDLVRRDNAMEAARAANRETHRLWTEWAGAEWALSMSEREVERMSRRQG